jgi:hypothetical protein
MAHNAWKSSGTTLAVHDCAAVRPTRSRETRSNPHITHITHQGCQIFLGTKYQNWEKYTK